MVASRQIQPLAGIRVVEVGTLLPGAWAATLLQQLGASVIRVLAPHSHRAFAALPSGLQDFLNAGKILKRLNLKTDQGRKVLERELAGADILFIGFRPAVQAKLALQFSRLRKRHPHLIVCSIVGYPRHGPYRNKAGHDLNYIALAGILKLCGRPDGPPVIPPVQLADSVGGSYAAVVRCLAALIGRGIDGRGSKIEVCMTKECARLLDFQKAAGQTLARGKMLLCGGLPRYNVYQTADEGYVTLAALEPKFWLNFCRAVGHPEWGRWASTFDEPLHQELTNLFCAKSLSYWRNLGLKEDICIVPVV